MSREERKMAQIIASIERMEQRKAATPSSASSRADSTGESDGNTSSSNTTNVAATLNQEHRPKMERMNSNEIYAQVQKSTRLGAKGKKLKPLSTSHGGSAKVRSGSKKAKIPQELIVNKKVVVDCKLTPKKRWIQLWNEQLSTSDDSADGDKKEPEKEPLRETIVKDQLPSKAGSVELEQLPNITDSVKTTEWSKPTRPTIAQEEDPAREEGEADDDDEEGAVKVTQAEKAVTPSSPKADEQKEASISPVSSVKESSKDAAAAARSNKSADSRRVSKKSKSSKRTEVPVSSASDNTEKSATGNGASVIAPNSDSDANLRVKTPQVAESSHLSPPLDRNSPAAAASISPSAKTKDAEPNIEDALPEESAPSQSTETLLKEAKASPESPIPRKSMAEVISKARDSSLERSRKRSLERKESEPLTEEEKRRAERRRKRKTNWDVGDPRFASRDSEKQSVRSPSSDDNSKFPPGRPSWRHSMSMDATHSSGKSSFQNNNNGGHRSSFSNGSSGPARRGFYQSNSLPLDRSRSAGRSSGSRYNYSNGGHR